MMMRMFSSSSPRSRRLAPRRKRAATQTLGVTALFALCIYSLTFNIKLHKEAENVTLRSESDVAPDLPSSSAPRNHDNVSLRPESDVAPVPVQTSNATIAITLSPPATKEKGLVYFHVGKTGVSLSTHNNSLGYRNSEDEDDAIPK